MRPCCVCGTRASAFHPTSFLTSSTFLRRQSDLWIAHKAAWPGGWCKNWSISTADGTRLIAHQDRAANSSSVCQHPIPPCVSQIGCLSKPKMTETSFRVLVVDDNVDAADSAAMLLRRSGGHDVRVAYSSQ